MSSEKQKAVDINELSLQQLVQVKQDLEKQLEFFQGALNSINKTRVAYQESLATLQDYESAQNGDELMVPLSESLFVKGRVSNKDFVLVDIGTGYFVEKSVKDAIDFYTRKTNDLGKQLEENHQVFQNKAAMLNAVVQTIKGKQIAAGVSAMNMEKAKA